MVICDDARTHRGPVNSHDYPHVLWFDYRLEKMKGVTGIKHGSSVYRKRAGESLEAFEGRVLAAVLGAYRGALGKDLRGLSAPPVPQSEKV